MTNPPPTRPAVFLVDDHQLVRDALARVLDGRGFEVCGAAGSIRATLEQPGLARASVVVVDLSLGPSSGFDLIPALLQRGLRIVVHSMHESGSMVRRALAAGAVGYVTKRETAHSLADALRAAMEGRTCLSPRAAAAAALVGPAVGPLDPAAPSELGKGSTTRLG